VPSAHGPISALARVDRAMKREANMRFVERCLERDGVLRAVQACETEVDDILHVFQVRDCRFVRIGPD
jgi:hypothetical protein